MRVGLGLAIIVGVALWYRSYDGVQPVALGAAVELRRRGLLGGTGLRVRAPRFRSGSPGSGCPHDLVRRSGDAFQIRGVGAVVPFVTHQTQAGSFTIAHCAPSTAPPPTCTSSARTSRRGDQTPTDDLAADDLCASVQRVLGAELAFTDVQLDLDQRDATGAAVRAVFAELLNDRSTARRIARLIET